MIYRKYIYIYINKIVNLKNAITKEKLNFEIKKKNKFPWEKQVK